MTQLLTEKWDDVLTDSRFVPVQDDTRAKITAQLLENQEQNLSESTNETGNAAQLLALASARGSALKAPAGESFGRICSSPSPSA